MSIKEHLSLAGIMNNGAHCHLGTTVTLKYCRSERKGIPFMNWTLIVYNPMDLNLSFYEINKLGWSL